VAENLNGKLLGMVFFNPSLRTRTSFEAAMLRSGGNAIVLEVGNGVWKLESRDGVIMDGDRAEHLREAVPVLSRYVDLLAVRSFSTENNDPDDELDAVIRGFREYSTVPVISMESAREHPCQGLADMLTLRENFGDLKGLPVTLSWAPHIKPLPKAVPNSFLLSAAAAGCDIRVAHPEGFDLAPEVLEEARGYIKETGGNLTITHDLEAARKDSVCLYAKAWRPIDAALRTPSPHVATREGNPKTPSPLRGEGAGSEVDLYNLVQPAWMPQPEHFNNMNPRAIFMHCLPTRRNLEVSEHVLDSARSRVVDEAENRFHVQRVMLDMLAQEVR
jgi:N-acetylornithine carbamoyltransferase